MIQDDLKNWLTFDAACREYRLPLSAIEDAIARDVIRVRVVAGERIVHRADAQALRLMMLENQRGCRECDDE